jgi:hypothetical protein
VGQIDHLGHLGKPCKRFCIATGANGLTRSRDYAKPKASGVNEFLDWDATFMRVTPFCLSILGVFTISHFYCTDYDRLMMNTTSFASRPSTNAAFIDLYRMRYPNRVAVWTNHSGTQLILTKSHCHRGPVGMSER